jgi:hypothetical protein
VVRKQRKARETSLPAVKRYLDALLYNNGNSAPNHGSSDRSGGTGTRAGAGARAGAEAGQEQGRVFRIKGARVQRARTRPRAQEWMGREKVRGREGFF